MTIITVVVVAGVTFIGFIGIQRLVKAIVPSSQVPQDTVDIVFNLFVLFLLLLTIVQLMYRFSERSAQHYRAIAVLTEFIGWHDDTVRAAKCGAEQLSIVDARRAREKYLAVAATLPPSTDKEFFKAKKDYAKKRKQSKDANLSAGQDSPQFQILGYAITRIGANDKGKSGPVQDPGARLRSILEATPDRLALMSVLEKIEDFDLWLAGGSIRNAAWDSLSSYEVSTPLEDVDVIWYDSSRVDPAIDEELERRLTAVAPNIRWDVKNQARMHARANHEQYRSLSDAMKRFPEVCSAVAARQHDGNIEILAPWGLGDLFSMTVAPSPLCDPAAYRRRVASKNWKHQWPELSIIENETREAGLTAAQVEIPDIDPH